jgi:predicted site-specific integrase-resolvase
LERQVGRVLEFCNDNGWIVELFKEIGSGLNDNRKEFKRLLKQIATPETKRVVFEFKDRVTRFGFIMFEQYCLSFGVEVVAIEEAESKAFEQEFSEDIIAIIASYSARLYGRRGGRKKACKELPTE